MTFDLELIKEWGAYGIIFLVVGVLPIALGLSLWRNYKEIECFEHPDLDELSLCVSSHQTNWLSNKAEKMGWTVISEMPVENSSAARRVRLKRMDEASRPLKQVLHALNWSLALPIGPLQLIREESSES